MTIFVFIAIAIIAVIYVLHGAPRTAYPVVLPDALDPQAIAQRKYQVAATVVPVEGKDYRYAVTLENRTEDTLLDGVVDMRWILHPGKFNGLDDTHMPDNIWVPAPIRFAALGPAARQSFEVDGYGLAKGYDGPREQHTKLFATRAIEGNVPPVKEEITVHVVMAWAK